jgi:hypothetical protein
MATTPNQPSSERDPSPLEVKNAFLDCVRHYWDIPREKSRRAEIATVILTVFIAGAAIYSGWVFQGQLTVARDQAKDATTFYKTDERAWISITATGQMLTVGSPIAVAMTIKNIGKTPARKYTGNVIAELLDGPTLPEFVYHKPIPGKEKGRVVGYIEQPFLLPNAEARSNVTVGKRLPNGQIEMIVLTQPVLNEIYTGKKTLFVHGIANYDDLFGISHWVRFCFYYQPTITPDAGNHMQVCHVNNDIDDNHE